MNELGEAPVIDTFGTGFQVTRLTQQSDGRIHWQRSPGQNHTAPYPPVPPGFAQQAQTASDPLLRFATPLDASGSHSTWHTAGRRSIARALLTEGDPTHQIHHTLSRLGSRLKVLHTQQHTHPNADYPLPPGLTRLSTWLDNGRGPRASAGFHYRLRSQLGTQRWAKLRSFTHTLLQPGPQDTPLHGWLTLGSIVLPDRPGPDQHSVVLSGIEAARGRPEVDLATVIGELEEFRRTPELVATDPPLLHSLAATFLTHYGQGWDRATVAAGAVTRIATHAHDFASYVGWHASLRTYIPMLADLLDSDGTTALPTM